METNLDNICKNKIKYYDVCNKFFNNLNLLINNNCLNIKKGFFNKSIGFFNNYEIILKKGPFGFFLIL